MPVTLEEKALPTSTPLDKSKSNLSSTLSTNSFQIHMTPAQWKLIPANPRQRNTEYHLNRATHLLSPSPTHAFVSMAQDEAGNSWKLDGHTRSLLWERSPNLAPQTIYITVYHVKNQSEAAELYTHFDSPKSVETTTDRSFGAMREQNWSPKSSLFKDNNSITTALLITEGIISNVSLSKSRRVSIYSLLPLWLEELKLLDSILPHRKKFTSTLVAAALLTIRRRLSNPKFVSRTLEFWQLYLEDKGVKLENQMDGVEALTRLVFKSKQEPWSNSQQMELLARAISSFEGWWRKHQYSSLPKQTDTKEYANQINISNPSSPPHSPNPNN